jgi:hypothetical protein
MLGVDARFAATELGLGDFAFKCAELHAAKIIDLGGCGLRVEVRFTSLKSVVTCQFKLEIDSIGLQNKKYL